MFVGYGPDTFLNHYPQDDFLAKIKSGYPLGWLVDKPHNLHLQIGINTWGFSLWVFLVLCGGYLWQSSRLYWGARLESPTEAYGVMFEGFLDGQAISATKGLDPVGGVTP